jgi:hypothetical protein
MQLDSLYGCCGFHPVTKSLPFHYRAITKHGQDAANITRQSKKFAAL